MHLLFCMAIDAHFPFLIMDIRLAPIFARVFRIDPAAMTEGAGLAFISLNKSVPLDEADADPANGRSLHMAVAAGCVATPAGLLEHHCIEQFQLISRKPLHDALALADRRIVKGLLIIISNRFMTHTAGLQTIRRSLNESLVGSLLIHYCCVTLMAELAALGKVWIFPD